MPTAEQIAKLPVWAQKHISSLEAQLRNAEEDRAEAYAQYNGTQPSRLYIDNHGHRPNIYLPEDRAITFRMNNTEEVMVRFADAYAGVRDPDYEHIYVSSHARHQLAIFPVVSNAFNIGFRERK